MPQFAAIVAMGSGVMLCDTSMSEGTGTIRCKVSFGYTKELLMMMCCGVVPSEEIMASCHNDDSDGSNERANHRPPISSHSKRKSVDADKRLCLFAISDGFQSEVALEVAVCHTTYTY